MLSYITIPTELVQTFKALSCQNRLQILAWLEDPVKHFPPQRDGDLVKDGVCVVFIAEKLGVAQPAATKHLQELARAELVISTRKAGWTFYKRNEEVIKRLRREIASAI